MPPRKTTTRIVAAAAITALLLPAGALAQAHAPPPRARAAPQRFKSQTPPADIPAPQKAPPQPSAAEQTPPAAKPPPATEAPCDEAALDARLAEVLDELATIEANIAAYKAANDELERKIGVERGRMKSKTTLLGAVRSEVAAARKRGRDASALTASLETEARQVEAELQELEAVHADVREILNMESHHRLLTGQVSEEAKTRMAQLKETLAEAKAAALKDETNLQVQTGLKKDKEEAAAKSYMTCDGEVAQLEQQGAEGASEEVQQKLYKVFKKRDAAAARLDAARTAYSAVFSKAREVARRQMPAQAPGAGALGRARDVLAAGVLKVERLLVDAIGCVPPKRDV
ncbi:unnamed protein product [Pedinophyceae sp. YPF-701]|nr:unnamed protein product [Pedinophyceae sp. YPF-701]